MNDLKKILKKDLCYEQHIVSIKNLYEESLFSILKPALYEGFLSLYKQATDIESKLIDASKKNSNVKVKDKIEIFRTLIKDLQNLNTHKIRSETDRIKSSTKSAEIFDDLVRAVIKSNIILLTYNSTQKRVELLKTKYHENIIIHDFIHNCYVQTAKNLYDSPELFCCDSSNSNTPMININQNKKNCFKLIKNSIKESIRYMLPMKEILLEYVTEQNNYNIFGGNNNNYEDRNKYGVSKDDYINANKMIDDDLNKIDIHGTHSLLDDNDNYDNYDNNKDNELSKYIKDGKQDFSLLLSESTKKTENIDMSKSKVVIKKKDSEQNFIQEDKSEKVLSNKSDKKSSDKKYNSDKILSVKEDTNKKDDMKDNKKDDNINSNENTKMLDMGNVLKGKGIAQKYFKEMIEDIKNKNNNNNNKIEITRITEKTISENK